MKKQFKCIHTNKIYNVCFDNLNRPFLRSKDGKIVTREYYINSGQYPDPYEPKKKESIYLLFEDGSEIILPYGYFLNCHNVVSLPINNRPESQKNYFKLL